MGFLSGKRALITGVASDRSIAWGTAQVMAREGAELFDRDDLLWIGSRSEQGKTPKTISKAFDDAGIYIMRESWERDALYLHMDAGPYSAAHQHEDKLRYVSVLL